MKLQICLVLAGCCTIGVLLQLVAVLQQYRIAVCFMGVKFIFYFLTKIHPICLNKANNCSSLNDICPLTTQVKAVKNNHVRLI